MVSTNPFPRLTSAEIDGRCHNIRYSQTQFHRLQTALVQHIDQLKTAIQADSGHTTEEVQAEICLAFKELRSHYVSLNLADDLEAEYRVANGKDNPDARRGAGIVYIIPCTHTMFFSVVSALSAAIAAGNCVILELAQTTMTLPTLLRKILPQALDADTFALSEDRPDASFLRKVLIISQNDTSIPPHNLVSPTTAKTIAVVDRTANIASAAAELVAARFAFGGRSTYSPDVVLVQEYAMKPFVEAIIQQSSRYLAGANGEARQGVVNPRRASSGLSLLDAAHKDAGARVLVSGSGWGVVEVQDRNSALLQKKVDEKVLIVHPVTSLDDAIDFSASLGPLAATYTFAAPTSAKYLVQFIDAYISWINHVPTDMLIGPSHPPNTSPSETRYTRTTLQVPRPQFTSETNSTTLVKAVLDGSTSKPNAAAAWREALAPLPATGQKAGWRIGFFEQGIITGGVITLVSFVAAVGGLGFYAFGVVRRVGF